MDALRRVAQAQGLSIIADATHAFGSRYRDRPLAGLADIACFSFDAIKNITCGGGGAVATNDDKLAQRIRLQRNLGIDLDSWSRRQSDTRAYAVVAAGYRYAMNNLNAAIGLEQLKRFDQFQARRRSIVSRYDEAFAGVRGLVLHRHALESSCPFSYVLRVPGGRRDEFSAFLRRKGIETLVQFMPNHLHPAFAPYARALPTTEALYAEIVSLPLYYEMAEADVETVIEAVAAFFQHEEDK
jgi:perosamine synthetase